MKVLCRRLVSGPAIVVLCLISGFSVLGQEPANDCDVGYQKFLTNRKGPEFDKMKLAISVGRDYIAKCGDQEGREETKNFVAKQLPKLDETVRIGELQDRFNTALVRKNWDDLISSGNELIAAKHPGSLDIMISLASIGYTNAVANPPVDKYNAFALDEAGLVIDKLNSGAVSESYGLNRFQYLTKACPDGKANAISWMNYTIGYIKYNRQQQRTEAIPYLLKAIEAGCELKEFPEVYRMIGSWYLDDAIKFSAERTAKIKAAGDQETDETKAGLGLINGYSERAMNAYARAFSSAKNRSELSQSYKDALYKKVQDIYESRFDGKKEGVDQFIAKAVSDPFPNPANSVTPVFDPAPVQLIAAPKPVMAPSPTAAKKPVKPKKPVKRP